MGTRLFVLVFLALLLSVLPLSRLAVSSLKQFGEYAVSVNSDQIQEISRRYLLRIAHEQSRKADAVLRKVASVSALMAENAQSIYRDFPQYSRVSTPLNLQVNPDSGIFYNSPTEPVVTAYWGGGCGDVPGAAGAVGPVAHGRDADSGPF